MLKIRNTIPTSTLPATTTNPTPQSIIDEMFIDAPPAVSRQELKKRTGAGYSEGTLANLDCLNQGIPGRFRLGNKVMYPRDAAIQWLKDRTQEIAPQAQEV